MRRHSEMVEPSSAARFDAVVSNDSLGNTGNTASRTTKPAMIAYRCSTSDRSIAATAAEMIGATHNSTSTPNAATNATHHRRRALPRGAADSLPVGLSSTAIAANLVLPEHP